MVTNWKKIFVKCLVNYWKITGKRLEIEQNGLINFDHSGAYCYPGDLETLSERKFCLFRVRNDISPGFSLTTAAGVHRQQKEQTAGTHGGTLWAVCSASGVSKALFALYCKKLNFLRDIRDFDSYISYKGFFAFWRKMSKSLERFRTVALFVLSCKKSNFLCDICDFDSYISYRGRIAFYSSSHPSSLNRSCSCSCRICSTCRRSAAVNISCRSAARRSALLHFRYAFL